VTTGLDMERILIATDGSDPAWEALHVGVELAAEQGTPVTIVHVVDSEGADISLNSHTDTDAALREATEIARRAEVEPDLELIVGDAIEEVANLAERIDADLVIVGSRGLGVAGASLLGSVSRGLLKKCKRPVLVVRGHPTPS
jgi:nucleotide-binding universal stress UspA family protein